MNKRGIQLAISTIVLLVIGVLVLIALILSFTGAFDKFWDNIQGYSGSDIDNIAKICQAQCSLGSSYSFCCEEKNLGKLKISCLDDKIVVDCDINCEGVCS